MIVFDKRWFNPLYFILNDLAKNTTVRTFLIYGGKSSAKTYSISQFITKELVVKQTSSIAFRKESTTIETTLKKSITSAIDGMYVYPVVKKMDRVMRHTSGAEIILTGIDDEQKSKGVEGYKDLLVDELNTFNEGEYDAFEMSLRGLEKQHIFATWNPIDEYSWVKVNLVDKIEWIETDIYKLPCENSFIKLSKCGLFCLIKTTYEDNFFITGSLGKSFTVNGIETIIQEDYGFIDHALIAKYEAMRVRNNNRYKVEVLGEWGKTIYGGEFLKGWHSEKHTGNYSYDPDLAIYLYFDENVVPYFPCGIFQVGKDQKSPRMIYCIAAKSPNNKVAWVCAEIARKLRAWGHKESVYVGGDATSQKDDVKLEKGDDMFRLIITALKEFNPQRRTTTANPSVRMSKDFVNSILDGDIEGMSFGADVSCRQAIIDYENTKEDKNGKVDKSTVTDKVTGQTYQPYGHFVDLTRYFICNTFANEYMQYQRGGLVRVPTIGKNINKNSY